MGREAQGKDRITLNKIPLSNNQGVFIGNLSLYRRLKSNVIHFEISFRNVTPKRMRMSTFKTEEPQAEKEAIRLALNEYKSRNLTGRASRTTTLNRLLDEYITHITQATSQGRATTSGKSLWSKKKLQTTTNIIDNHIRPSKHLIKLDRINDLKIEDWVNDMRDSISDKTVSNVKTVLKDVWQFGKKRGYLKTSFPEFPTLVISQTRRTKQGIEDTGFATCSFDEFIDLINTLTYSINNDNFSERNSNPHNYYVFNRWLRILMDSGIRPILPLSIHSETKKFIFFERYEKQIHYWGRGQKESKMAIKELMDYYNKVGINCDSKKNLILNSKGENYAEATWDRVKTDGMKRANWSGKVDEKGLKYASYSVRHCHITNAVANGENPLKLAKRCGTSVKMLEKYYYEHDYFEDYPTPTPFK